MNTFKSTFNVDTQEWTVVPPAKCHHFVEFQIAFTGNNPHIIFDDLSFGFELIKDGDLSAGEAFIDAKRFPEHGIIISEVFSDLPAGVYVINVPCETDLVLKLWSVNAGQRNDFSYTFTSGRPEQPYPSWTWSGSEWQAPVARPKALTTPMWWNEKDQQWEDVPSNPEELPPLMQEQETLLAPASAQRPVE